MHDRLASHSLFKTLSEEAFAELSGAAELREYKAGETLIQEGEFNDTLFVLIDGSVRVENQDTGYINTLKPDAILGEISTTGLSLPVATVTAEEDSKVIAIPIEVVSKIAFEEEVFANALRALGMHRTESG